MLADGEAEDVFHLDMRVHEFKPSILASYVDGVAQPLGTKPSAVAAVAGNHTGRRLRRRRDGLVAALLNEGDAVDIPTRRRSGPACRERDAVAKTIRAVAQLRDRRSDRVGDVIRDARRADPS